MTDIKYHNWSDRPHKNILFYGMSGLGKTHLSNMLRRSGDWFHYSVDYRIGTRYMGEHIVDNFKHAAMTQPLLARLLKSDSIYIGSNITFENLEPLSTFLGEPGDITKGGLPFDEYSRRQGLHFDAEKRALKDSLEFLKRSADIYNYPHFICDTGGSICEVIDPFNPNDPLMTALSQKMLPIWIKGDESHSKELIKRFKSAPKPMYFGQPFLNNLWQIYLDETGEQPDKIDPDEFMIFAYQHTLSHRMPKYEAMSKHWGISIKANELAKVKKPDELDALIQNALDAR